DFYCYSTDSIGNSFF
nr:immunoglobulin light chain junction region [Macaca mulatta]